MSVPLCPYPEWVLFLKLKLKGRGRRGGGPEHAPAGHAHTAVAAAR